MIIVNDHWLRWLIMIDNDIDYDIWFRWLIMIIDNDIW